MDLTLNFRTNDDSSAGIEVDCKNCMNNRHDPHGSFHADCFLHERRPGGCPPVSHSSANLYETDALHTSRLGVDHKSWRYNSPRELLAGARLILKEVSTPK